MITGGGAGKVGRMPRLQAKSFANPDSVRPMPLGTGQMVNLGETVVGRSTFEPGWRWSTHLRPIMGTPSCPLHHLGYSVSGLLRVQTDDGQTLDIGPDTVYEIPAGHDAWVVGGEAWTTIEWTSARAVGLGPEGPDTQVIATLVMTDIVDSTAAAERLGEAGWRDQLSRHNTRVRELLNTFRGREVKTTGDGFLVVLDSASRACRAAAAISRAASDMGLPIRSGVNTGEIEFIGDDVRGLAVHAAARIMSLAQPGEVLVSATTRELLTDSGLVLQDAGVHQLKGLTGARQVYRLIG